jgi:two-component system chemotaxis response regulator CheB
MPTPSRPCPAEPLTCAYAIIGIGASLGGLAALTVVLSSLPDDFPLPILVVQHMLPDSACLLPAILRHRSGRRVVPAIPGERPSGGTIHVAQPDHHLLVAPDGTLSLCRSARVNFTRPAVDVLFQSLAEVYAERAVGLVLTGMGRDGARGLAAIRAKGGLTMAQDDATAEAPDMPCAAIDIGKADVVLPLCRLAAALVAAGQTVADGPSPAAGGAAELGGGTGRRIMRRNGHRRPATQEGASRPGPGATGGAGRT